VLRVGSTKELKVDVRVVAATHRSLDALVGEGRFRPDLLFRRGGATITLPPLRERPRDIVVLARAFLAAACARAKRAPLIMSAAAMQALVSRPWPGNVRELRNVMDYVAVAVPEQVLGPWHLP